MDCRRQALQLCLDAAVVVVVKIIKEFPLEVLHRLKFLQVKELTFEQAKEIFNDSVIQTVAFPAHTLLDTSFFEHSLVLLMLVPPALIRNGG